MSQHYEIDDSCPLCEGRYNFTTEKLKGHSKRHRIATCTKCGDRSIIIECSGC